MKRTVALLTLLVLASLCIYGLRSFAQSGPPTYTITLNATYPNNNLLRPTGISTTPGSGWLFFSDTGHHMIRALSGGSNGWVLHNIAGSGTAGYKDSSTPLTAEFNYPSGVSDLGVISVTTNFGVVHFARINVLDTQNFTVRRICAYFSPLYTTPCVPVGVSTVAGTNSPGYVNGVGTNARFQNLLGRPVLNPSDGSAETNYVVDPFNDVVRYIDSSNNVSTFAGAGGSGYVNGPKASAKFNGPSSATLDLSNNLYVSDVGNFVIRKIDTSGNVSTFTGSGVQGYLNGGPSVAKFAMPTAITYNKTDHYWYVADSLNNCIRRVDSSGNVTTYAGSNTGGDVDGTLSLARFSSPADLVIDGTKMYITDSGNNAIRQIDMSAGLVSTIYK